jgi:hypothetical protein
MVDRERQLKKDWHGKKRHAYIPTYEDNLKNIRKRVISSFSQNSDIQNGEKFLTSPLGANFLPQGRICPPGVNFVPKGWSYPLGVKFSVRPSILLLKQ